MNDQKALNKLLCDFEILTVGQDSRGRPTVWIVDSNKGKRSVTNDAEAACKFIDFLYPDCRIVYRDSDGHWDTLLHSKGRFTGFEFGGERPPGGL